MKYKQLGNTDLKPSTLGFGCSRIASLTTRYPEQEILATLQHAFDSGITFFDTANIYGQGDSEGLLGRVFSKQRDQVIFCSKAGLTLSAPQQLIRYIKPVVRSGLRCIQPASKATTKIRKKAERQCFEPTYIKNQIEGSLKRLRTDYLDLFLLHNPPQEIIRNEELKAQLETLKSEGKLRYYGISCRTHEDAALCLQQPGISSVQINLDASTIDKAEALLKNLKENGCGVIARECLNNKDVMAKPSLSATAANPSQPLSLSRQALEKIMQNENVDVALAGMACRKHLIDNLKAISD